MCLNTRFANTCAQIKQVCVIFYHFRLWIPIARHLETIAMNLANSRIRVKSRGDPRGFGHKVHLDSRSRL